MPTSNPEHRTDDREHTVRQSGLPYPSDAYNRHVQAFPHRLSELIFGSLLASYILGFISVSNDVVKLGTPKTSAEWISAFGKCIDSIIICGSFSFLTASYFLIYHNAVLTVPKLAPGSLRIDFRLAISQALLFGVSILVPDLFPAMIGISLGLAILRQDSILVDLSESFSSAQAGSKTPAISREQSIDKHDIPERLFIEREKKQQNKTDQRRRIAKFRVVLKGLITTQPGSRLARAAQSWSPPELPLRYSVVILIFIGVSSAAVRLLQPEVLSSWVPLVTVMLHLAIFIVIYRRSVTVLSLQALLAQPSCDNPGFDKAYAYDNLANYVFDEIGKF